MSKLVQDNYETPKTIKFNWEILKKYTDNNPRKMIEFFNSVYVRKTENYFYLNPWAAKIVTESDNSQSYIQNVSELMLHVDNATDSELFVYLDLCSQRSYFDFMNTGGRLNYLPFWKIVNYDVNTLKMNRLLTFDDKNIYLLYEIGE